MANFEVRIEVKVNEVSEVREEGLVMNEPVKVKDGTFKIIIPDESALSIDKSEQAFLKVGHEAIRDGISSHLSQISKKKPLNNKE